MHKSPVIKIKDLSFQYRSAADKALNNINLEFGKGEFAAVIGPSRAGKSTLCLTMNGLIPHSLKGEFSGSVCLCGVSTADEETSGLFQYAAIVFQDFESQLFSTCAAMDVAFGPENLGLAHDEIVHRVNESLKMVDLSGYDRRDPSSLSGGQKQRLAIASVLALHSPVIILDEPTTDLDPVGKQRVMDIANDLRMSGNYTIVCVEHEIEELMHANRIILMVDGKVLLDGAPKEVFQQVDLLRQHGVMPLGVCELMHTLNIAAAALTVDEGCMELKKNGFELLTGECDSLELQEQARTQKYGDVMIDAKHVSFGYDASYLAVNDVSLTIQSGEFVAILGQNGSGKTTLAKCFNNLLRYQSGNVLVNGREANEIGIFELSKTIGYVFQNPDHQIFADTVYDEVAFGPKNHGYDDSQIKLLVEEALEAVGLTGREQEDPFSLTKGERQRVAVASVLAMRTDVLILDEPTTGLDYSEQTGIMELLKRLNHNGITVIIITHTMWVVSHYAHRAIVMNEGRVVFDDKVRTVFSHENELVQLHLKPPQITTLGNRMGFPFLTVEEGRRCLAQKKEQSI